MWLGSLRQGNDICRLDLAMDVALVLIMGTKLALVNRNLSRALCGSYIFESSPTLVIQLEIASVEDISDIRFPSAQ